MDRQGLSSRRIVRIRTGPIAALGLGLGAALLPPDLGGALSFAAARAEATIDRFAGPGRGDGCPPLSAFVEPNACTILANGVVYIADGYGNEIRRIGATTIERVAGTGQPGAPFDGDGGAAVAARLNYPGDVAVGPDGTIYFTDTNNHLIKAISPTGTLRTLSGGFYLNPYGYPFGVAIGPDGALYVADSGQNRVLRFALPCQTNCAFTVVAGTGGWGFSGDGGPATAATLRLPRDVTFDAAGNLYIADSDNHRIRKVTAAGTISTVAGGGSSLGDGGPATAAKLIQPFSVAVAGGDLFIADTGQHRIRKVDAGGVITTVAGTGVANPTRDLSSDPLTLAITLPKAVCTGGGALLIGSEADRTLFRLPLDQAPPTVTRVATATRTGTRTATATATLPPSATLTATRTATRLPTSTSTATTTRTGTPTRTASFTPTPPFILICDVTGNAFVSTVDATRILQAVAGTFVLDPRQVVASDATGDGTISTVDAVRVLQYVAGLRPPDVPASRCGELVSS